MNIHEYQAKELLAKFGVAGAAGAVAYTAAEAVEAASELGGKVWAVKAQIHAGGRGKAGGVKLARSRGRGRGGGSAMLGKTLVTHQTGPEGRVVKRVYVEAGCDIARELYLALSIDRAQRPDQLIAAAEGGVDIEELAARSPEKIVRERDRPGGRAVAVPCPPARLRLRAVGAADRQAGRLRRRALPRLHRARRLAGRDQPAGRDRLGRAAGARRQDRLRRQRAVPPPEIEALRDEDEEDPIELEAEKHQLNYVKLDGNIGCMVNGAGLAMATMDIIKLYGGSPANFLDVGGGATKERVTVAFKLILSDPNVEAILVNIFGGIMRCDVIAEGIVSAAREINLHVPLVVRLEGTNVELGRKMLQPAGLPLIAADDLEDAARKVVAALKEAA